MILNAPTSDSKSVEVYLQSTVVKGTLVTKHQRLSDHLNLRLEDEFFNLVDARPEDLSGNSLPLKSKEFLISMQDVLFIADLSVTLGADRSDFSHQRMSKETRKVLLGVGPFWIRGNIHLIPEVEIQDFVVLKIRFIPVTDAKLLNRTDSGPQTFLINRSKIGFLAIVSEE